MGPKDDLKDLLTYPTKTLLRCFSNYMNQQLLFHVQQVDKEIDEILKYIDSLSLEEVERLTWYVKDQLRKRCG